MIKIEICFNLSIIMVNSILAKLSDAEIVGHIRNHRVEDERDIIFGSSTGRKFLHIRFNDFTPDEVINSVADHYSKKHHMRVDDIEMPHYIILRVQLSSFSSDYRR